jgi:hypothetical protein
VERLGVGLESDAQATPPLDDFPKPWGVEDKLRHITTIITKALIL